MDNFNDVTEAFDGWLSTITGIRKSAGSYVDGRWVDGSDVLLSFQGVVQNASPKDLKVLEEGMRTEEVIKIHTEFSLIVQVKGTQNGDTIIYKGENWLVHNIAKRFIGGYSKALCIKQA